MSYDEISIIVNNYLTDIDTELVYYYTNYFFIAYNDEIIDQKEFINILKKLNKYGKYLKYYDNSETERLPKGYVSIDENCDSIFIRNDLTKEDKEKAIYHEIHHLVQLDEETIIVSFNDGIKNTLIIEGETEYVSQYIYNRLHGLNFREEVSKSEDIYMYEGEECISDFSSYQLFGNILIKFCLFLDISRMDLVHICNDNKNGEKRLAKMIDQKIDEYTDNKLLKELYLNSDAILYLLDIIGRCEKACFHDELEESEKIYVDKNNYQLTVSFPIYKESIEKLDLILFTLIKDKDKKEIFKRYIISKSTMRRIDNIKTDMEIISVKKLLEC